MSDFTSLEQAVNEGGTQTILISGDIEMGYLSIPKGADITLKPEGKSVTLSFNTPPSVNEQIKSECIYVRQNSNLTLSGNTGYTLTIKGSEISGPLIANIGKLTLESGAVITCHTSTSTSAGVKNKGVFIMNGGEISHMSGKLGGAVSVIDGGSFIMNSGIITKNIANNGAGIYLSDGSVSINGGSVSQNNGYDIEVVGRNPLTSSISISGEAVISSIHFQNGNLVPVIQADSKFSGEVKDISYENYVPKTKAVDFQSSKAAQNLQNKFHIADKDYCLVPSGNYLIIESAPDFQFAIDNPTNIIIPKYPIKIPVSLEVTNGKVSMIVVTLTLSDYSGNQVQSMSYDYNLKDGVKFDVIRKEGNTLTLSTGTDITQSIEDLLTLTISDADLAPGEYTVTLEIESSVSNTEDYPKYPTQTLKTTVNVVPLILAETANTNGADKLGTPVWSFKQKASVTYVISPFDASLEKKWPAVSRHASPDYSNTASELTEVKVYKSTAAYDSANQKSNQWIEASSTVSKNTDGTIKFNLATSDSDAKCFKIVFTGRKVGDVVEGTGDIDNVNLYDVDMILHAVVEPELYIKPEWRLYADTDSDGKIMLADAMNAFNFIKGY
ncbi:MAG TPA: hypothetical protein O0X21_02215 [Methanocorpusculum sp.]|nr:hypothetical protein [Methanocorpusculum sp.]HJJ80899.1 hypothetical protein [Methanocorpusculum sp.]